MISYGARTAPGQSLQPPDNLNLNLNRTILSATGRAPYVARPGIVSVFIYLNNIFLWRNDGK